MRLADLRRTLTAIILAAPLASGCVSGNCSDEDLGYSYEVVILEMPNAELKALVDKCRLQHYCEPLCIEVSRTEFGEDYYPPSCKVAVDSASGKDVVVFEYEIGCIGRRPSGYHRGRGCGPLVGSYLAQQAALEAASVRAFGDLHDDLKALGAPVRLRRAAITAAADEVRHARTCSRLARHHGATPAFDAIAPGQRRDLRQFAIDNMVEGCVRETYGAVVAGYQGRNAGDAMIRRAMKSIARDEARHAALSWRIHAWLWPRLSPAVRRELANAAANAREELGREAEEAAELRQVVGVPDAQVASGLLAQLDATVWA